MSEEGNPVQQAGHSWDPTKVGHIDLHIAVSVAICYFAATALDAAGFALAFCQASMDVVQLMAACISCILCCQDGLGASRKAGATRLKVTLIGGLVGMAVVALDDATGVNPWLLGLYLSVGVVAALVLCRRAGAPTSSARIGALTVIIVCCGLSGATRLPYAALRVVSTLFGVAVALIVTWVADRLEQRR